MQNANVLDQTAESVEDRQHHTLPFIRYAPDEPDLAFSNGYDGWCVTSSGDWDTDVQTGWDYAELAVRFGRSISHPNFISFILCSMMSKAHKGSLTPGIDHGFILRVSHLSHVAILS